MPADLPSAPPRAGWDFSGAQDCLNYHALNYTFPGSTPFLNCVHVSRTRLSVFFSFRAGFCNATWDNYLCWPLTAPGKYAEQPCPANVKGILRDSKRE